MTDDPKLIRLMVSEVSTWSDVSSSTPIFCTVYEQDGTKRYRQHWWQFWRKRQFILTVDLRDKP